MKIHRIDHVGVIVNDLPAAYKQLNQFSPFLDRYASNMPYFDFLDRLSSTACTEGLTGLSLR